MVTLVETSVLVAVERGQLDFSAIRFGDEAELAISTITAAELLHGVYRAVSSQQRARREAFTNHVLGEAIVLPFDMAAASIHAQVSAELAKQGTTVGAHDLLIAASALSVGGRVATRDLRSFPKIPGLEILAC